MSDSYMDTIKMVRRLREAGFTDEQAETVTELIIKTKISTESTAREQAPPPSPFEARKPVSRQNEVHMAESGNIESRLAKWVIPLLLGQAVLMASLAQFF